MSQLCAPIYCTIDTGNVYPAYIYAWYVRTDVVSAERHFKNTYRDMLRKLQVKLRNYMIVHGQDTPVRLQVYSLLSAVIPHHDLLRGYPPQHGSTGYET